MIHLWSTCVLAPSAAELQVQPLEGAAELSRKHNACVCSTIWVTIMDELILSIWLHFGNTKYKTVVHKQPEK